MKVNSIVSCSRGRETAKTRLVTFLRNAPDDEVFTATEVAKSIGIPHTTLDSYRSDFTGNNFKYSGTRWWGTKTAIAAAKKEIEQSENI